MTSVAERVTCLIADDHPPLADLVRSALEERGFDVVATAFDGRDALAKLERLSPDIAILDITMPQIAGLELARRVRSTRPATAVIIYTGSDDPAALTEGLDAGARGYVLKSSPLSELVRAVEIVAVDGTYVDPVLAGALAKAEAASDPRLTKREREVLRLLAGGHTYAGAGHELFIAPETVRMHVRSAMRKLEADTRTQAVATALRKSLIR